MNIAEALQAVADAKRTMDNADATALSAARLLVGRLRKVEGYNRNTLKSLKKELRDFNAATGKWKEES